MCSGMRKTIAPSDHDNFGDAAALFGIEWALETSRRPHLLHAAQKVVVSLCSKEVHTHACPEGLKHKVYGAMLIPTEHKRAFLHAGHNKSAVGTGQQVLHGQAATGRHTGEQHQGCFCLRSFTPLSVVILCKPLVQPAGKSPSGRALHDKGGLYDPDAHQRGY